MSQIVELLVMFEATKREEMNVVSEVVEIVLIDVVLLLYHETSHLGRKPVIETLTDDAKTNFVPGWLGEAIPNQLVNDSTKRVKKWSKVLFNKMFAGFSGFENLSH